MSILATTGTAEVVAAHEAWLRRVVRRRMADPALVDDAVQEALLRACRSSPPADPAELRPWLTTIAKRTCVDVWRAHRRTTASLDGGADRLPAGDAVVPGSDEHLGAVAARTGINRALDQLSPRHRRLLEKQALLGLSYEEIADEEDVSIACVTSALGRARAGFRRGFAAPAWVLVDRVRARLQAVLTGHAGELAAASMTIGVAAVVLVAGGPPPEGAEEVQAVASSPGAAPTAPLAAATVARGQRAAALPSAPTAPPPRRARGSDGAGPPTVAAVGDVGDVSVPAPHVELTPQQWTLRYGVQAEAPNGTATVRVGAELHCAGGVVVALVCPLAPQP